MGGATGAHQGLNLYQTVSHQNVTSAKCLIRYNMLKQMACSAIQLRRCVTLQAKSLKGPVRYSFMSAIFRCTCVSAIEVRVQAQPAPDKGFGWL